MAVKLRLRRMGKKKQPIYKVVAADSRSPRDGRFLESIGLYNPRTEPITLEIDEERAMYWLNNGAQPTDTVKSLLSKKGLILKRELIKRGLSEEKINQELEEWQKQREAGDLARAEKKKAKKEEPKTEAKAETEEQPAEEKAVEKEKPDSEVKEEAKSEEVKEEAKAEEEKKEEPKAEEEKKESKDEEEVSKEDNEGTAEVKGATSEEDSEDKK